MRLGISKPLRQQAKQSCHQLMVLSFTHPRCTLITEDGCLSSSPGWISSDPVVFGHISSVRPNCVKGWSLHFHKNDRYTLVSGEVLVALWDARLDSPTHGIVQRVYLAPDSVRQVLIPAGVWHAAINLGIDEAFIINMPTQPYDHASPDKVRLSTRSPLVPVDLADFFPSQFDSSREKEC